MAVDATGTPTSPDSIPKYATSADAPSGKGFNAAMDAIQTALSGRWLKTLFTATGDIAYASGVSTPARLGIGSTGNVLTVAGGLPAWAAPAASSVTVASTIAGLGTATDGKQGRLRLATTPFEFIDLVYDATYAKWVSPAVMLMTTTTGGTNQGRITNNSALGSNAGQVGMPNYKSFFDAGLKLQVRATGIIVRATASDQMLLYYTSAEHNTAFDTGTAKTTWGYMINDSSAGNGYVDGGWITDPNVSYAKPHVNLNLRLDNGTAARMVEYGGSVWGRWIG